MRILAVIALAFTILAIKTGAALAHAYPVHENPPANAVLKASPQIVSITFTEGVNAHFSGIIVTAANGRHVDNGIVVRDPKNHEMLSVGIENPLVAGVYKVIWHALSEDGHRTQGSYQFSEAQ
jgi:methionine-rich copper-binding protein CopC